MIMKLGLFLSLGLFLAYSGIGQSIPIVNQKMTDYFTYDPSRTGLSGGSLVFSHQQLATGFENSPITNFLGGHTRILFDQIGLGGNLYYQESGIIRTYRIVASGAYHMRLNDDLKVSFGIAPEFTRGELNFQELFVLDMDDPVLQNYGTDSGFDVSSGVSLHHRIFDAGVVLNRMISVTQGSESTRAFPGVVSVYGQGKMTMRSELDLLEPMVFVNRYQDGTTQVDVGGFYTYENLIFAGLMYRTQSQLAMSLGYNVKSRLVLGYSYQTPISSSTPISSAHEITIRVNLNKQYFESQGLQRDADTISPELKGIN